MKLLAQVLLLISLTGLYPFRNGCAWNHGTVRPDTKSLPHHLKPLGYRVGLAGKVHVKPKSAFPFVRVPGFDPNCVRSPTQPHDTKQAHQAAAKLTPLFPTKP
ncbi:MAG: N-sulfoglucosamine sulfohydrolase [Akkermansiaceae bacterium]|jgi:N-sulfoglucosamine sulfohydrolase